MEKKDIIKSSKTFCMAPWVSIHSWPDGRAYPCCLWDSQYPIGNYNDNSLKEIWNSPKLKETRIKMLNNESVDYCKNCYHIEKVNDFSYRNRINDSYGKYIDYIDETNIDGSVNHIHPHLWDVRISNVCNFKCRSCGPELSSTWFSDAIKIKQKVYHDKPLINLNKTSNLLEELYPYYDKVNEIYFAGGEPLITEEHYQILDELIKKNKTDVLLRYSTNFSTLKYKDYKILDYWKYFSNIDLFISVDGVGKIGEYVRKGFNTTQFYENINTYIESGIQHREFAFMVTYGTLNYLHLFDLVLDFCKRGIVDTQKCSYGGRFFHFSPITYPPEYNCSFLPTKYKTQFKKRLDIFKNELIDIGVKEQVYSYIIEKLKGVYNHSISDSFNKKIMGELVEKTKKLDKVRGESFMEVFDYYNNLNGFLFDD